jgi:hypothetical protein
METVMSTDSILAKVSLLSATIAASIVLFAGGSYARNDARGQPVNLTPHAASGPVLSKMPPVQGRPISTTGNTVTTIIVRDHRPGHRPPCYFSCTGEAGLGVGEKPAQLPYGYQLPQGGQVRDHRNDY